MGCDPFMPVAQILLALQTIPSRRLSPLDAAVISVTQVHGGDTWNVIPEIVVIRGTARCFSESVRDAIESNLRSTVEAIAAAHGATTRIKYEASSWTRVGDFGLVSRLCLLRSNPSVRSAPSFHPDLQARFAGARSGRQ
jgi:metal-dependent amidase/aminoacylase/carboxypeptidase family protein